MAIYRRGVTSLTEFSGTKLRGDVTLSEGNLMALNAVPSTNDISISTQERVFLDWDGNGLVDSPTSINNMVFIGRESAAVTGSIGFTNMPPNVIFPVMVVSITAAETVTLLSEDYHFMPGDSASITLTDADNGRVIYLYYIEGSKIWVIGDF